MLLTDTLDQTALYWLQAGGKVLLSLKKGSLIKTMGGEVAVGFSSIFWNTAWTNGQAPHTLGILCHPAHPALRYFPTDYYSNYQWWDAISHSDAIHLSKLSKDIRPLVRVIDDWVTNRSLGLLFEVKVGNGKLLVSGIDFHRRHGTSAGCTPTALQSEAIHAERCLPANGQPTTRKYSEIDPTLKCSL